MFHVNKYLARLLLLFVATTALLSQSPDPTKSFGYPFWKRDLHTQLHPYIADTTPPHESQKRCGGGWCGWNFVEEASYPKYIDGVFQYNYNIYHPGWDMNVVGTAGSDDVSTKLRAVADGIVISPQGFDTGKNYRIPTDWNELLIRHNVGGKEWITAYGHSDRIFVKNGDVVQAGDLVATLGEVKVPGVGHVHFEVRNVEDFYENSNNESQVGVPDFWDNSPTQNNILHDLGNVQTWYYNPEKFIKGYPALGRTNEGYFLINDYGQKFRTAYDLNNGLNDDKTGEDDWDYYQYWDQVIDRGPGDIYVHYWPNQGGLTGDPNQPGHAEAVVIQDLYNVLEGKYAALIYNPSLGQVFYCEDPILGKWFFDDGYTTWGSPTGTMYVENNEYVQNFEKGTIRIDKTTFRISLFDGSGVEIALVVENKVILDSDPPAVEVWNGSVLLGNTPMRVYLDNDQTKTLTAKMAGYYDKEFPVEWQDGQEVVTVELEPVSTGTGGTGAKHYSLATEPGYLDFGLTANELVFSTNDGVSNGTVNWTITPSKPWISTSLTEGSNSQDITVTINRDGLSGYYEESITIASNAGTIYLPVFVDAFSSWSGTQVFTFDDQSALDEWLVVEGTPDSSKVRGSALRLFNGGLYRNRSLSEAVLTAPGAIFDSVAVTFDLDNESYSTGNQVTTVYVNWQDANHSYRWLISNSASDQRVKFQKVYPDGQGVQQTATLWEQSGIALGEGTYRVTAVDGVFTFRDEPSGSTINASVTDATYSYGRIGFGVSEEEALIDNVTVTGHTPVVYRNAAFAQDEHTLGVWNMAGALGSAEKRTNAVSSSLLTETGVTSEAGVNYALDRSYGLTRGSSCLPTDLDTEIDGAAQLTIEGWFQFNNSDNNVILGRWDTGQSYLQLEWNSSYGPLYAFVASSASDPGSRYGYSASIERENERWYYIALVYDGTASSNTERLKLYIDGQEVPLSYAGTIPASLPSLGNTLPLVLGYRKLTPAGSTLGGRIGAVRVSSIARSSSEIADQYSQSLSKRAGPGSEADIGVVPEKYALHAAYPNPFNPTTTIPFDLPRETHVSITVYDMLGREVATLISERRDAGAYTIEWNGKNTQGHSAASGVYLYRMKAGSYVMTRKLTLLK